MDCWITVQRGQSSIGAGVGRAGAWMLDGNAAEGSRFELQAQKTAAEFGRVMDAFCPQETHLQAPAGDGVSQAKRQVARPSF